MESSVVIGVIGKTGAGRSSLMNVLIGEELVPTSGMMTCTAVATEIAYNDNTQSEEPYQAEVKFVTREKWKHDLSSLLAALTRSEDGLREDVASGLKKIRAVYPKVKGREDLRKFSVEELLDDPSIQPILSSKQFIREDNCAAFNYKISKYIRYHSDDSELQFWPLIKSVRLYTRSPLLRGVVLVDLPATQQIAQRYKEKCTGFLVVADIRQAVTAKDIRDSLAMGACVGGACVGVVCTQVDLVSTSDGDMFKLREPSIEAHLQLLENKLKEAKDDKIASVEKKEKNIHKLKKEIKQKTQERYITFIQKRNELVKQSIEMQFPNIPGFCVSSQYDKKDETWNTDIPILQQYIRWWAEKMGVE